MSLASDERRRWRLVALLTGSVAAAVCGPAAAGTQNSLPDGLKIGRLIVAPYLWTTYEIEDNIFRQSEESDPSSDNVSNLGLGAYASLPFKVSEFNFGVEAIKRSYETNAFTRDTDISVDADVILNFSSFDTLTIRNNFYSGFTDVDRLDDGSGEQVFDGEPFKQYRTDLEILRGVANEKGYYVRFSRAILRYDDAADTAFYDYDGWDVGAEYRQPFASYKWLVVYAGLRNFDHTFAGSNEVDRTEESQTFQLGVRGVVGKGQPFVIRVGYSNFEYVFPDPADNTDFTSVAAHARLSLRIGGRSRLDLSADRRPLPSNFDTSYLNGQLQAAFQRPVLRDGSVSLGLRFDNNVYSDPIVVNACNGGQPFSRHDRRYVTAARFDWQLGRRFSYRMETDYETRSSTCSVFTYDAMTFQFGVLLGWY